MSEEIKITIVMYDEITNGVTAERSVKKMELTQKSDSTLMPVLLENGLMDGSFCGGRGDCGRCVVQFLKGAPLPTGLERNRLEPKELRQGYRLACVTRPKTDCTIRIVETEVAETPIVTGVNFLSDNIDLKSQEKSLSENQTSPATKFVAKPSAESENEGKKSSVISEQGADVIETSKTGAENSQKTNSCYIIAVDLGTTTIAMQLRDAETGEVVDTYCAMNPQRRYGAEVLARIQASVDGQGEELRRLVCGVILGGLGQFTENLRKKADEKTLSDEQVNGNENKAFAGVIAESVARKERRKGNVGKILCMCIAGNTAMEHLLLGMDVSSLGRAPFVPTETGVQKESVDCLFAGAGIEKKVWAKGLWSAMDKVFWAFPIYIAPCISAFVGGDIVAGLYALGMISPMHLMDGGILEKGCGTAGTPGGRWQKGVLPGLADGSMAGGVKKAVLLIDLGTNGEMVITNGQRMVVTATAAGPAFEGDGTMMGTDRIALTAQLLRRGILDETGLLEEPYFTDGVRIEGVEKISVAGRQKRDGCYFNQKDIRAIQMAKAAIRAGVEILWEEMGCPEIEKVFLAGGFGYYLDVEAAVTVGLLPSHMRGKVQAVGNTSLAGAYELGRDLWGNRLDAALLEERISLAESINLAETERFEELYLKYMNLGEN